MTKLAIVIPTFKDMYFEKALTSLANQTCKDFNVYIGNDNSPYDLENVVNNFSADLNITYTKFNDNIGARNLVLQWKRCVELVNDEEWIWLFSDDDIAEGKCVEEFYSCLALHHDAFDVYRFNTIVIDRDGAIIVENPIGPEIESSAEMAYHLMIGNRGNSMPDHIFSKKIYDETGGFVFTKFAQSADWATSIKFSQRKGMCIIPNAKVFWRLSGMNISSKAAGQKSEMISGYYTFIRWILIHFDYLKNTNGKISFLEMKSAVVQNWKRVMYSHYKGVPISKFLQTIFLLRNQLGISYRNAILMILRLNRRVNSKQ